MVSKIYKSPSEQEVNQVMESLVTALGWPPEGVIVRKESEIQEFCVTVDTNTKNTEALCYLASCLDELAGLERGSKRPTIVPTPAVDKSLKTSPSFWAKGKRFLKSIVS